jgi:hypothetical protein
MAVAPVPPLDIDRFVPTADSCSAKIFAWEYGSPDHHVGDAYVQGGCYSQTPQSMKRPVAVSCSA